MKRFKIFMILLSLVTIFSLDSVFSMGPPPSGGHHDRPGCVGVPLDGGLLALLGAAGIAYFAIRKKKKDSGT